ncbi:MAG TPA: TlpA disulfide reductase family protein [Bacillota bacterium]
MQRAGRRVPLLGALIAAGLIVAAAAIIGWWPGRAELPSPGGRAPGFALATVAGGRTVALEEYRGQPVIVNFWATWCPPCVKELPVLEQVAEQGQIAVLAVNVGDGREQVQAFTRQHGLNMTVLLDQQGEVAGAYGMRGLPETFFIDDDGVIRHIERGALTEGELAAILRRLGWKGA